MPRLARPVPRFAGARLHRVSAASAARCVSERDGVSRGRTSVKDADRFGVACPPSLVPARIRVQRRSAEAHMLVDIHTRKNCRTEMLAWRHGSCPGWPRPSHRNDRLADSIGTRRVLVVLTNPASPANTIAEGNDPVRGASCPRAGWRVQKSSRGCAASCRSSTVLVAPATRVKGRGSFMHRSLHATARGRKSGAPRKSCA